MRLTDNINHIIINGEVHVADLAEFFAEHEPVISMPDGDDAGCLCGSGSLDWPTHMREEFIAWIKNI